MAGNAADLDHRQRGAESHDHRHLQEDAEEIADIVRRMFGEALGAIAPLEQESFTLRRLGEQALQLARLASEDERRERGKLALDIGKGLRVRIIRRLLNGLCPPVFRRPGFERHDTFRSAAKCPARCS